MTAESFFALVDGEVLRLESQRNVPADLLRMLPNIVESVVGQPMIAVGSWEDEASEGPLVLALNRGGQLVSLIAVSETQLDALGEMLTSMDEWLASLDLRSLAELSGNRAEFYEGLLDLSPDASIVLSPVRQYVLVTALPSLDVTSLSGLLPAANFTVRYLEVLQAPGGTPIFRFRHDPVAESERSDDTSETTAPSFEPVKLPRMPENPSPDIPDEISPLQIELEIPEENEPIDIVGDGRDDSLNGDSLEAVGVAAPDELVSPPPMPALNVHDDPSTDVIDEFGPLEIDLTDDSDSAEIDLTHPVAAVDWASVPLEQGATYDLAQLPLLFDPTSESVKSISNELFAVGDSIVMVVELPERRRETPFEDRRKFRWDTSLDRVQLLNEHSETESGTRRTVHLFVEAPRMGSYAMYVGEISRTAFQTQTGQETAWFSVTPPLSYDLYRMLRKGRLPGHTPMGATVD